MLENLLNFVLFLQNWANDLVYLNCDSTTKILVMLFLVLSDPHTKAIYDTMGVKGLETDGWQVWKIKLYMSLYWFDLLHKYLCLEVNLKSREKNYVLEFCTDIMPHSHYGLNHIKCYTSFLLSQTLHKKCYTSFLLSQTLHKKILIFKAGAANKDTARNYWWIRKTSAGKRRAKAAKTYQSSGMCFCKYNADTIKKSKYISICYVQVSPIQTGD